MTSTWDSASERAARDVERPGMQHHRGRDVVERSGLEQQHFSAAGLLGGGAEQHHRQAQLVGHLGQRQRRADGGGRDDVVAAGMSDPGSASYSAQMPTTSGPLPKSARNAVSNPPGAAVISNPCSATSACVLAQLR